MTQRKPGNILIALLISSLAFTNPMMAAKRATAKKTTVTITVDGDAAIDATCCDTDTDAIAKAKAKAKTDATCADACADSCPLDPDATRVLAPAQAGGVIVTPAFEYSIKSSDLSTPLANGWNMFSINTPGRYYLASDTAARNAGGFINATMIYINANNVIFDMNGKTLFPNGTGSGTNAAGLTGIQVASGLSNIVITNGQINGYQPNGSASYITNGIAVGSNCHNLTISNITLTNIGGANAGNTNFNQGPTAFVSALIINGATGANVCSDIILQNINVSNTNSSVASTSAVGLFLSYCNNVKINSCNFCSTAASGTGSPVSYGACCSNSNTILFNGCVASQNGVNGASNPANGFYDTSSLAVSYTDCDASQTTGTNISGFNLINGGPYKLTNCTASNGAGSGSTYGFNITALANMTNCTAESNTATGANICYGLFLNNASGSKLTSCQANNNIGGAAQAAGIYISNSDGVLLNSCSTSNNISTGGSVTGFCLSGSDSCRLESCLTGENHSGTASIPVYGFYTNSTSNIFNNCVSGHNYNNATTGTTTVAGFYFSSASGNQLINCQARNNSISSTGGGTVAGFYSTTGTANEFRGCQAVNNTGTSGGATAAGVQLVNETRSQILACNCSSNNVLTSSTSNIGYGIYLQSACSNTVVRDNLLNFNVGGLMYGFYDSAGETTSVLINNQATGQGRCTALLSTSFHFPADTSMNFYFQSEGTNENPRNIIMETDNFNWQTISTAVALWSNISIVIGQVS